MEQILPIVIALIFFAYKQYTKHAAENNKFKSSTISDPNIAENANIKEPSLDDYISKFMGINDDDLDYDIEEYQNKSVKIDNSENEKDNFDTTQMFEKQVNSIGGAEKTMVKEESEVQFRTNINNVEKNTEYADFDIRQAVLYDAVFNPPYINN